MLISSCTLYLLLLTVHGSIQKPSPAGSTYRAAVVELTSVFYRNDPAKTLNDNARKFVGYIDKAAEKGVDIIVFPELGLTSLVLVDRAHLVSRGTTLPDPSQNYMPCEDSSFPVIEAVKTIACAAQQNGIYVVVNLLEKEVCSGDNCPSDGIFLYITSVVFDRKGRIVARYRKAHLFAEYGILDAAKTPEISTFDTDFGVTFGNIIGSDIMFEEPWLTLTRKLNTTDIILPAGFFTETPFLSTIQTEAGLAYAEDINMLASGHNRIEAGNSGSGIYAGRRGVITAIMPLHDHEEMLVADVWKKIKKTVVTPMFNDNHMNPFRVMNRDREHNSHNDISQGRDYQGFHWRYEKLDAFKTKLIVEDGLTLHKLNHFGINCRFQVNVTNLTPPVTYRLLAFDGTRTFNNEVVLGIRTCAIVQCANDTIGSCGHVKNSSATFNFLAITARYVDGKRVIMTPSTLGTDMLPMKNWTLKDYKHKENISMSISLATPTQNLVTFGIWGRNFDKDKTISSASRIIDHILCLPLLLVLLENVSSFL